MATVSSGLRNMYYARLIKDDRTGVEYEKPKHLAHAIAATVTPVVNSATVHADNIPILTANALGEITVEINVLDIPFPIQADLLGLKINADGVLIDNEHDQAPEVAIAFERETVNGSPRYTWLLKGRFKLPSEEAKTIAGTPDFQTPKMSGVFVRRLFDGHWRFRLDSGGAGVKPAIVTNWFNQVYRPPSVTALDQGVQVDGNLAYSARDYRVAGQTRVGDRL